MCETQMQAIEIPPISIPGNLVACSMLRCKSLKNDYYYSCTCNILLLHNTVTQYMSSHLKYCISRLELVPVLQCQGSYERGFSNASRHGTGFVLVEFAFIAAAILRPATKARSPIPSRVNFTDLTWFNHVQPSKNGDAGWLVVEPYPSKKYEFVSWDDDILNIWKNKKPPNHQSAGEEIMELIA